jgi:hypothetical protein
MATYATVEEFIGYTAHLPVTMPEAEIEALLVRAERDVDALLGWPPVATDTPRVDLDSLTEFERGKLRRATCAQAAFRVLRDESSLVEGPDGIASVDGLSFSRDPLPSFSPEALLELSGTGGHLYRRSGTLQAADAE